MRATMTLWFAAFIFIAGFETRADTNLEITVFQDGHLTWTNVDSNLYYTVEWRPSLTGTNLWTGSYRVCQDVKSAKATITVPVPAFYRVVGSTNPAQTQSISPNNATVKAGYYNGTDLTQVDSDLISANIRSGVTLFGVNGNSNVVNTSSGNASAEDLALGKIAWVDGTQITGTLTTGTTFPAPLQKTGQTISYYIDLFLYRGDDGALQFGVAWPTPRFTVQSDTNLVVDTLTGLMWARNANLKNGKAAWTTALDYCHAQRLGGYDDWRLPNIRELHSLVNYELTQPALPSGHPFSNVQSATGSYYWSSTTRAGNNSTAWILSLQYGDILNLLKAGATTAYVWPVRGGEH